MHLMTLNIWGGHVRGPLLHFITSHQHVDIFCFQEVYHQATHKISTEERTLSLNIFSELSDLLPNHRGFFKPTVDSVYGIATFIKKEIDILQEGEVLIHHNPEYPGHGPTHQRNLHWVELQMNDQSYTVINVHGLWNGRGKTDTPERVAQSEKIREFMDSVNTPKILCGDFNLRPDTESLKIVANGMNNLVEQYNITSTRTSLYPKPEKFADYIFTSPEININQFKVLQDEVSDHAPLLVEFL